MNNKTLFIFLLMIGIIIFDIQMMYLNILQLKKKNAETHISQLTIKKSIVLDTNVNLQSNSVISRGSDINNSVHAGAIQERNIFKNISRISYKNRIIQKYHNLNASNHIAVLVLSSRDHFEHRKAIRETWGNNSVNVFFIVGSQYCKLPPGYRIPYTCRYIGKPLNQDDVEDHRYQEVQITRDLIKEKREHPDDMVVLPIIDVYRSLTKKMKYAYGWIVNNTNAKWILKVDDDMVVRTQAVFEIVRNYTNNTFTVIGCISYNGTVLRRGKWAEFKYAPKRYPPFPVGSCGYIISRDIAEYFAEYQNELHEYQGEDVSVGIWLSESLFRNEITFVNLRQSFVNNGYCKTESRILCVVMGHYISPQIMRTCFRSLKFMNISHCLYLYKEHIFKKVENIT